MAPSNRLQFIVILATLSVLAGPSAWAWQRATTDHGTAKRWSRAHLTWSCPAAWQAECQAAAAAWSSPACTDLRLRPVQGGQHADITVQMPTTWPHGDAEVGHTELDACQDSGLAARARIDVRRDRSPPSRKALLVHEFGHALGLAHRFNLGPQAAVDSVMLPGLSTRTQLGSDDAAAMCALFPLPPTPPARPGLAAGLAGIALSFMVFAAYRAKSRR